jgi:hypothetical protein
MFAIKNTTQRHIILHSFDVARKDARSKQKLKDMLREAVFGTVSIHIIMNVLPLQ